MWPVIGRCGGVCDADVVINQLRCPAFSIGECYDLADSYQRFLAGYLEQDRRDYSKYVPDPFYNIV